MAVAGVKKQGSKDGSALHEEVRRLRGENEKLKSQLERMALRLEVVTEQKNDYQLLLTGIANRLHAC